MSAVLWSTPPRYLALAAGKRCARSWKVLPEVGLDPAYPDLSLRDAAAMREYEAARQAASSGVRRLRRKELVLAEAIRAKADEMDAMHEKGIKSFPAPTEGKGNQPLAPRLENGVKVFDLETSIIQWEVEPGRRVEAWAYNGQVPGPQIRVREGDRVRINLRNGLEESTAIHFHGLEVPNDQDGVPFITQPPVKPGESYTYEFVVPNSGSVRCAWTTGSATTRRRILVVRAPIPTISSTIRSSTSPYAGTTCQTSWNAVLVWRRPSTPGNRVGVGVGPGPGVGNEALH